jgi:hypothetical protein
MTDKHVDELLADLDRALALDPSPSVAASVRARIEGRPVASWFGLHWQLAAAAAGVVVLVAGYVAWPRSAEPPAPAQTIASHTVETPAATVPAPPAVTTSARPMRATRSTRPTTAPTTAAVEHEPEVLVSPSQRIGLAQLAAALREGRISADAIPPDGPIVLPDPIVIPIVVIEPIKLDLPPGRSGGQEIR